MVLWVSGQSSPAPASTVFLDNIVDDLSDSGIFPRPCQPRATKEEMKLPLQSTGSQSFSPLVGIKNVSKAN